MERKYYIYKIINVINKKVYIGQTLNPNTRWSNHQWYAKNKPAQYIHRAMAKYGIENFNFEIISEYLSKEEVDLAEDKFINEFNSRNKEFGYNIKPGGHLRGIWKHSEETKQKFKLNWKIYHPPESIEKTAAANRGKKRPPASEERKRKIGEANKIALKGKKQSEETIQKRVESIAEKYGDKKCNVPNCDREDGYKHDGIRYCELHIQRLLKYGTTDLPKRVAHNKGKSLSEETKNKLSNSLKGRKVWNKGVSHSEETKKKLSNILKGQEPPNKIQFTKEEIESIKKDSRSYRKLAAEYGVSTTVIMRIKKQCLDTY